MKVSDFIQQNTPQPHKLKNIFFELGVPQRVLAIYLKVSVQTLNCWLNLTNPMPPDVEQQLTDLANQLEMDGQS